MENEFEYIGKEEDENGKTNHIYNYKFTTGDVKLGEDDGSKYAGINVHDEIMYLAIEQFKWGIIKFTYKYDLDVPEGLHEFMKKFDPNNKTTLEELKETWDFMDDLK